MNTYSDPGQIPCPSHVQWHDTYYGLSLDQMPAELFLSSENLQSDGWPDFSVNELADWQSSITPSPNLPIDDCCLVAALPSVSHLAGHHNDWRLVVHETGGIWQEPRRALVRRLTVTEHGQSIALNIARHMATSSISARFASFDQLTEYRNLLNGVGLDCNGHVRCLAEAFYPIDLTEEAISILGVPDCPIEIFEGSDNGGMFLAIMAPNCSEF
jgi:hypothetical protein